MLSPALKWLKVVYNRIITSIAFLPAIMALSFLGLSILMINIDFSSYGKNLKSSLPWLSLKDASTARSICSSIAGGIISLSVFSFSMVMILLSQAASQMSNRILGKLISNRFQQIVLGFYIGTIVYALFLLSTIRDIDSGVNVPAISTYLLIALTVVDIFLFIYFLHYVTQSVKFETIINRIYIDTKKALKKYCTETAIMGDLPEMNNGIKINAPESGIYQGFQRDGLIDLCKREDAVVYFHYPVGTYVMKDTPLVNVICKNDLSDQFEEQLNLLTLIGRGQEIETTYYYGLRQLVEIAIKALSPGINDPGTAAISLQAIGGLIAYRMDHSPAIYYADKEETVRIVAREKTFDDIFEEYVLPIWDYGKEDRLVQKEMHHVLSLLNKIGIKPAINRLLQQVHIATKNNQTKV